MRQFFWVMAFVGALFGLITLVSAFGEDSSPKQAAAAGLAVALAVIPYCFARAISELSTSSYPQAADNSPVLGKETRLTAKGLLQALLIVVGVGALGFGLYAYRILNP